MSPNTISNLLGTIESPKGRSSYTDHQLHILAIEFSKIASQLQNEDSSNKIITEYSIHDFYPKVPLEDKLVEKEIVSYTQELYPTGAVYTIIEETDFLKSPKTVKEITDFVNSYFERDWKTTDLGSPLDRATLKGLLIKTDPPDAVTYKIRPR